ncbi:hypothetical protein [Trichormus azollae]|uniref:hypothetical protein n=1 Tax=Trichormus azollae TaxID=1164 RepID=UPI00325D686A
MVEGNFDRLLKGKIQLIIFKNIHIIEKILGIIDHQFQDWLAQAEMQHEKLQAKIVK